VSRPRLLLLPLAVLLAGAAAPAQGATTVRQAAGSGPAAIQSAVDQFRADLGAPNTGGAAAGGRRDITWDDVPPDQTNTTTFPGTFYSGRGVKLTAGDGGGLEVSSNEFGHPATFTPFSAPNLFNPVTSPVTVLDFSVPGTTTTGLSRGFGAVFTHVTGQSRIQLLDANGTLLANRAVPTGSLSFLGVSFSEGRVAQVRVTSGNTDTTVLDDFIYGEPVQDLDADGISQNDNCARAANATQADVDDDGEGDACDVDADNDGIPNDSDAFPLNRKETTDTDGDGIGDNADPDDDNDGLDDKTEGRLGTDPKRPDSDADGHPDGEDNCPLVANADQSEGACIDLTPPTLTSLTLRPNTFHRGAKAGTRISFRVSERATVQLSVMKVIPGIRRGAKCVSAAKAKRARARHPKPRTCTLLATVHGTIARAATSGVNFVKFEGRIGGKRLKAARYVLVARATDAAGNEGRGTVRAKFRVLR
jgi:hypothetical protein